MDVAALVWLFLLLNSPTKGAALVLLAELARKYQIALMICRAMILLIGFVPVKVYSVMICPAMTLCDALTRCRVLS